MQWLHGPFYQNQVRVSGMSTHAAVPTARDIPWRRRIEKCHGPYEQTGNAAAGNPRHG